MKTIKDRIFPIVGAIIVFILSFGILYFGDNVGLSDNGDFRRVMLAANLEYDDDSDYYYLFKQDYRMINIEGDTFFEKAASIWKTNEEQEIYKSPHFIFIKISKEMNFIWNEIRGTSDSLYDIGFLAAIYCFMLSLASFGIFTFFNDKKLWLRLMVFLLFIFMFCDAGYILYFNSLYGEPLQYVSLMMLISVGLMIYKRPSLPKVIYFYTVLYFFAGSKLANVPYSIIISLMAVIIVIMKKDKLFKIGVVIAAVASVSCMLNLYIAIPDWMQDDTTYQSVFFGLMKESDTPKADLAELGVDERYSVLVNTHAYMDADEYPIDITTQTFKNDFSRKVSKLDIAFFYMRHPGRLFDKLKLSIENSAYIRPPNNGNSASQIMTVTNKYSMWSNLRVWSKFLYSPGAVFTVFILLTLYIIALDIYVIKKRKIHEARMKYMMCGFNVLILGLWINLVIPIIGNGEADLPKHMFLFINCIDILFAVIILYIATMKPRNKILSILIIAVLTAINYFPRYRKTIEFGTYNGEPVEWEIYANYNDGSKILVTKDCVAQSIFDEQNNMWETSDLRSWLNNEFLAGFTEEEKALIQPVTNEVILSYNDRGLAVAGDHTHYWNFTRDEVNDLAKTAYHYYIEDYVYIPTLDMMHDIDVNDSYWVLCPYASNDKMERYMKNDGFILHTNVNNVMGVRAVIKINNTIINQ